MNRKSLNAILIAAVAVSIAACNKENGLKQAHQDRSLSFDLSMAAASRDTDESGASTKSLEIMSSDGNITLPMEYRVKAGIGESSLAGEAQTKVEQINDVTQLRTIGMFKVAAWNFDSTPFIPPFTEVNFNSDNSKWVLSGTVPFWENADVKTFLAYANLPANAAVNWIHTGDGYCHTFSYSLQTGTAAPNDALLGYYQGDGDGEGVAKIRFIHPLTAVEFKMGKFEGITAITSLSMDDVFEGGAAVVTYSYDTDGNLIPSFDWGTSRSTKITVSQSIPAAGQFPIVGETIGEPFIILPQDLSSDNVTIRVGVTLTGGEEQEIMAELNTGEWKEGKTNTYTLGYDPDN